MKNVIREIHRRSLWQVLGIYLAVSWMVLQVVDVIGNNFGLPAWVAPAALVLLLLGLPVVIATAFVQHGLMIRERGAPPAPSREEVGEVEPLAAPNRTGRHKLLTWRNALVGGGVAFAVLAMLTGGYLLMRASGIGPAGTLVARGVLEKGAQILLAEFESTDPDLADVVTGALRIDLAQSPTIRLVSRSTLAGGLQRMQREEGTAITSQVARELAVREGYDAIIEGEIGNAGSGYVLTANIVGGESWEPLAGFRVTARSDDDLIDAIEELSRDIRDKAGESLRSVQGAPGLRQVSTSSLEALRLYSQAEDDENRAGDGGARALELYEQAVAVDPEFAMAYRKIGVALGNLGIRRDEQIAALRRAFDLRERLTPAERHLAEAYYYAAVTGDRAASIRAYERVLETAPDDRAALNNLAVAYLDVGREAEGEPLLEHALSLEGFTVGYNNLAWTRLALGDRDAALATYDEATERLPEAAAFLEYNRILLALDATEYDLAADLGAAYAERFRSREAAQWNAVEMGMLDGVRGRHEAAGARWDEAEGAALFEGHPMRLARHRASLAIARGDSAGAVRELLDAYRIRRDSLTAQDRVYGEWLTTLIEAGGVRDAERIYGEWLEQVPDTLLGIGEADRRRAVVARLTFARGDSEEAARLWEIHGRECPSVCWVEASLGLADIYEARGDVEAAIEAYEQFLTRTPANYRYYVDIGRRGPVLERLGQLLDRDGDHERAAGYYRQFVDLWSEADEALQPRVRAAQARLEEIVSSRG